MKLNKCYMLFAAMCSLASNFTSPVIVRVSTYAKEGHPDIHLLGDQHNIEHPRQEQEMIKALVQKKDSHVYVEDWLEHAGPNQDNIICNGSFTTLKGLANKIRKAGSSVSIVECRMKLRSSVSLDIPHQESVQDYKNIRRGLKTLSPKDPVDILSNTLIEKIEELEKSTLKELKTGDSPALTDLLTMCGEQAGDPLSLKRLRKKPMFARRLSPQDKNHLLHCLGNATVDVIAFKQLCKNNDGSKQKFLIAGAAHCDNIEMLLKEVGYRNTRRLEEDSAFLGFNEYKQFLPQHCAETTTKISNKDFMPSVSPKQIKKYFKKPNSYRIKELGDSSRFAWLKNKALSFMGRA